MTIGTLVAFTALQAGLFRPITGLLNVGVSLVSSLALFARIFEYLDLPVEVDDPADPVDVDPARVRGHVRIEDVTFSYPGSDTAAVAGVTLDVPAGSTLALVGETGSGKSTLAALVARLHDPDAGRITIDGIDLRDLRLADLAAIVGVVSQETYLLHTTVRENLRYARPDATDAEIEAAARAAQIHDLIDEPAGGLRHPRRLARPPVLRRRAASASRSPARCCATRGCWCSTRRPAPWTPRPNAPCSAPSTSWAAAARRSPSRTGSRRSATPTGSRCSTTAGSSSRARTTTSSPTTAATPRLAA